MIASTCDMRVPMFSQCSSFPSSHIIWSPRIVFKSFALPFVETNCPSSNNPALYIFNTSFNTLRPLSLPKNLSTTHTPYLSMSLITYWQILSKSSSSVLRFLCRKGGALLCRSSSSWSSEKFFMPYGGWAGEPRSVLLKLSKIRELSRMGFSSSARAPSIMSSELPSDVIGNVQPCALLFRALLALSLLALFLTLWFSCRSRWLASFSSCATESAISTVQKLSVSLSYTADKCNEIR